MVKTAFEPGGLLQAHSAAEALDTVRELEDLDLVLLDLKLPDVEGFQGLLQLRKAAPRIPILVLSGLEDARLAEHPRGYGALGYVTKKSSAAEIVAALGAVLSRHNAFAPPPPPFSSARPAAFD